MSQVILPPPNPHNPYGTNYGQPPYVNHYTPPIRGRIGTMRAGRFGRRFVIIPSMSRPEPG